MDCYVVDTSVFTNPEIFRQFGEDAIEALSDFIELAKNAQGRFYMPSSTYQELGKMREMSNVAASFQTWVSVRSPRKHQLQVPSQMLYEFVEEVRMRIDQGLRIAEEHTKLAGEGTPENVGQLVHRLRQRYREALRQGLLDSTEDLDAVLLALELDATLVSADYGMRILADKFGVKLVDPANLRSIMENLSGV